MTYNSAGQFSTDNPVSDRMQIDEEQFDLFEFEEEEDVFYPRDEEEWDFPVQLEVVAWCHASDWHDWRTIDGTFEAFEQNAQQAHDRECKCGDPGNFDAEIISK